MVSGWAKRFRDFIILTLSLNCLLFVIYLIQDHTDGKVVKYFKSTQLEHYEVPKEQVKISRLTDIVVPLPPMHYKKILDLLETWKEFPPCYDLNTVDPEVLQDETFEYLKSKDFSIGHDVTLTFYVSSTKDLQLESMLLTAFASLKPEIRKCFSKARVHFAGLYGDDDGYWKGTTIMFERLLKNKVGLRWPHYVFYMEPDMLPMRKYWLTALDSICRETIRPFWVKGSIFKGIKRIINFASSWHINGNAIYNLADPEFVDFYFNKVDEMAKREPESLHAYDLDVYYYLTEASNYDYAKKVFHKFQYTDVIQNFAYTNYTIADVRKVYPNAFLVHGGLRVD